MCILARRQYRTWPTRTNVSINIALAGACNHVAGSLRAPHYHRGEAIRARIAGGCTLSCSRAACAAAGACDYAVGLRITISALYSEIWHVELSLNVIFGRLTGCGLFLVLISVQNLHQHASPHPPIRLIPRHRLYT